MSAPTVDHDVVSWNPSDPPITVDQMVERGKLMTLDEGREVLASTEPLAFQTFETGEHVRFRADELWNSDIAALPGTSAVPVWMTIGPTGASHEYQLTLDAVYQAASFAKISKGYLEASPGHLLEFNLNYWYRTGLDRELKLMLMGADQLGAGVTRETVEPFSNLTLLNKALDVVESRHPGTSVWVDRSKLSHSLRLTHFQLVLPEVSRLMENTNQVDDRWWGGIQMTNSMSAEKQTMFEAFLYRQRCTNGYIDMHGDNGKWNRKSNGQDMSTVLSWAEAAVNDALSSFEGVFDKVQSLVDIKLDPGTVADVATDLFDQYKIPNKSRSRIMANLVESDQLDMYHLTNAVTQAANGLGVDAGEQQRLMRTGGDVIRHTERCTGCHRVLPDGMESHGH